MFLARGMFPRGQTKPLELDKEHKGDLKNDLLFSNIKQVYSNRPKVIKSRKGLLPTKGENKSDQIDFGSDVKGDPRFGLQVYGEFRLVFQYKSQLLELVYFYFNDSMRPKETMRLIQGYRLILIQALAIVLLNYKHNRLEDLIVKFILNKFQQNKVQLFKIIIYKKKKKRAQLRNLNNVEKKLDKINQQITNVTLRSESKHDGYKFKNNSDYHSLDSRSSYLYKVMMLIYKTFAINQLHLS
ncbi:unnamed protein product [Paramecium octaurelia]|uniref:Uncharacterized protein n=1 Tax=Paramecium octaurelia TaxID=43137 RepID=A0A8S1TZS2_PAROT|nr:unnamed protein product [Paramecium octaurelia]